MQYLRGLLSRKTRLPSFYINHTFSDVYKFSVVSAALSFFFESKSESAIRILAKITRIHPKTVVVLRDSLNTKTPTITLVMGSSVLSTEVFSPPIINAPCWKRTTAPVVIAVEKSMHIPHPKAEEGRARLPETIQAIKVITELAAAT